MNSIPNSTSTPTPTHDRSRILSLDGLRGLAALFVVLYHFTTRYGQLYNATDRMWFTVPWGHYGVRLFFVISGFVIFMTIDRVASARQFAATRFARLFPVFWVCVGITYAVVQWTDLPGRGVSWGDALWNLTMVPKIFRAEYVDGVYWSLREELSFYLFMGLVLAMGLRRYALAIAAFMVVASMAGQGHANMTLVGKFGSFDLWVFHFYWMSLFLLGMTLYDMQSRVRWWHFALLLLCLGEVGMQRWYWKSHEREFNSVAYLLVIAGSGAAVFTASRWSVPGLTSKPIVFLGTISYSWYLIHQNVGYAMIRWMESLGGHVMLGVGVAFVSTIAIAYGLTRLIEQPANRWLRRVLTSKPVTGLRPGSNSGLPTSSPATSQVPPTA